MEWIETLPWVIVVVVFGGIILHLSQLIAHMHAVKAVSVSGTTVTVYRIIAYMFSALGALATSARLYERVVADPSDALWARTMFLPFLSAAVPTIVLYQALRKLREQGGTSSSSV